MTAKLNVVVIDDYQGAVPHLKAFSKLDGFTVKVLTERSMSRGELLSELEEADVIVPVRERTAISEDMLKDLPNLKLISQTGKGCAHIDLGACTRLGIAVAASSGNSYAPAELTWALILASMRNIPAELASANSGKWQTQDIGRQLRGRVLGIYGYGSIGSIVAGYGKAFGMKVIVWGREGSRARALQDGYETVESREQFFAQADVLSVHLRLTPDTKGIVTAKDLSCMKPDALFVNTSRADLVEPGALATAIEKSAPGYAAIDGYESEPALDYALFNNPRVLCSPHLGYVEKDTYEVFFGGAFDNIVAFASGVPTNIVNPEVLG